MAHTKMFKLNEIQAQDFEPTTGERTSSIFRQGSVANIGSVETQKQDN
jgi:hypothetical protein